MLHTTKTFLILLFALAFLTAGESVAKEQALDQIGTEIIEALHAFYPVTATEQGIHSYDHRLADYSSKSVKQMIKSLDSFERKLYKFKSANLPQKDAINYRLLKSNVDIALLDLKQIKWYKKAPQLYVNEATNGLYFLLLSQHAPLSEKVISIVGRMKGVPGLFASARKNLKNPPPIYIEAANEALESATQFYQNVAADLMRQFPERADEILKVSTAAREAMNDFAAFLAEIKPGEEKSFAIGKENYNYKLSHEFFFDFDADSLLKIGETLLADIQMKYRVQEENVENNHQNGRDSVFVPAAFSKQDILDYYVWETDQIKIFLEENDFVTIPENIAPISVIETPPFLSTMISGIAYQPAGPFDINQHGYFYVRPIPDDLERGQLEARYRYVHRRGFKSSAVHEAFPGHHLQMQLAARSADPVRKSQFNNMMIEGWALYCEEMMYQQGLYGSEDPAQLLDVMHGIRFRAARIVADVKLHTGQFTYEECADWMIETLGITAEYWKDFIRSEVRRYTFTPSQPMTYLMGKREIMSLLEAARDRDGASFSYRAFHDTLLGEGSIPPVLMWEIMGLEKPQE